MQRSVFTSLAVALILAAGVAAAADTIREVQVRQLDTFTANAGDVLSFCSAKPGAVVSQTDLSRDVRALLDTGRYGYAGVEIVAVEGGVRVVYVVKRRYRYVAPPAITGVSFVSEARILEWLDLKEGAFIDEQLLAVKCAKVRDEYVKRYFPKVTVTADLQATDPTNGLAKVALKIDEGKRAKIDDFVFEGNKALPDAELRATFGQRPWYDPRGWFSETPYDDQRMEEAREKAREAYLDKGYLDVKVSEPRRQPAGSKKDDIVFTVEEGQPYTIEALSISGVTLFPTNEVLAAAQLRSGDVAGRSAIQNAVKGVRDYYGARGYVETGVRPIIETPADKPGRATIRFDVRESQLIRIRNIVIRGNTRTKDKVIRREIAEKVSPGEVMNEPLIERSENRLKNLNYFSEVRHYTSPGEQEGVRDLVFEVKEQRTGNFMIGAGFSSVDNLVGFAEITQSNFDIGNWPYFTGGGQKARAGFELGSTRQTVELGWTEPWFLDKPIALTTELFRRMRGYDEYDDIRMGGSAGLSYPVAIGRIGFKHTLEQVELDEVAEGPYYDSVLWYPGRQLNAYRYTDEPDSAINSAMRVFWSYDTRDQAFVPTRGVQATVFGELAGTVFGGDNDVYSMGFQARRWFPLPWGRHVLSLRARAETVDAYTGEVPIYDRLFLGGGRTVRGFENRSIGPLVVSRRDRDWHPIGGQTLMNAGAEYTIPVFKAVRVAGFGDIGSLGADSFSPETSSYAASVGVGLRIDIPGFPVRLDYAVPVVTPDNAGTSAFVFWIGFE
jgi:outer membrane protein insertion porin family